MLEVGAGVHEGEGQLQGHFAAHHAHEELDLDVVGDVDGEDVALLGAVGHGGDG